MARNERYMGQYETQDTRSVEGERMRRCTVCGEFKLLEVGFHKNGMQPIDGNPDNGMEQAYRLECKVCYNIKRNQNTGVNKKRHSDFIGGQKRRGEAMPEITRTEWKELLLFFGGECAYCGATPRRGQSLTRDHLCPVDEGGRSTQDNIVPACLSCNSSKGNRDFKNWFMAQSFFSQNRLNRIFQWRTILRQVNQEEVVADDIY